MGGYSARKALEVVSNVETIVAIELLCACQALEFHRPCRTTESLESLYERVRQSVNKMTSDRYLAPDIEVVRDLIQTL